MKHKFSFIFLVLLFVTNLNLFGINKSVPRDTSYTVYSSYIKELKRFPFIKTVDTTVAKAIKSYEKVVYKKIADTNYGDRELKLSVYRPDNDLLYPAVLMIHGGGWNSGTPDMQKHWL